jgi:hypothetical protein
VTPSRTGTAADGKRSVRKRTRRRLGSDGGFDPKLIAPLVSGAVLNPVNSSIVAVALVPIGVAFGAPPSTDPR